MNSNTITHKFLTPLHSVKYLGFKKHVMSYFAMKQVGSLAVYSDSVTCLKGFQFEVRKGKTIICEEVISDNTHYSRKVSPG